MNTSKFIFYREDLKKPIQIWTNLIPHSRKRSHPLCLSMWLLVFFFKFYYILFVCTLIIIMWDNWDRIQVRLACVLKLVTLSSKFEFQEWLFTLLIRMLAFQRQQSPWSWLADRAGTSCFCTWLFKQVSIFNQNTSIAEEC